MVGVTSSPCSPGLSRTRRGASSRHPLSLLRLGGAEVQRKPYHSGSLPHFHCQAHPAAVPQRLLLPLLPLLPLRLLLLLLVEWDRLLAAAAVAAGAPHPGGGRGRGPPPPPEAGVKPEAVRSHSSPHTAARCYSGQDVTVGKAMLQWARRYSRTRAFVNSSYAHTLPIL